MHVTLIYIVITTQCSEFTKLYILVVHYYLILNIVAVAIVVCINSKCELSFFFLENSIEGLSHDGVTIAVASSVTVLVVNSVVFFIIGCSCGHFCGNRKQELAPVTVMSTMPVYDDISPRTNNEQEVLELKANLAYGPLCQHT